MDMLLVVLILSGIAVVSLAASLIVFALGFVSYVYKEQRGQRAAIERLTQAASTTDPILSRIHSDERARALAEEQAVDIQPVVGQNPVEVTGDAIDMP